ncbi:taste receptor type 2 member 5 [Perognathus longimembris pacificus]|uniref:taste receptor type 2 member 5 n=1 Tax=Perognathus longimembris pacificus TaxID=214514 RepID=UPI002018681A|nr:taste receptor type 2 member 5 [Perognathus longimembris pacificus]
MPVAVAEFLIGLVGNGVLVVWSFGEWIRKARGSSYKLVVLGLAGCRFLLQWMMMLDLSLLPYVQNSFWLLCVNIVWSVMSQASLWFAALLSVVYCKKITTFQHPAYLWLKQRVYSLSLCCLLGHLIINLVLLLGTQSSGLSHANKSIDNFFSTWQNRSIFHLTSASGLPLMMLLVSSGMLTVSLYRHHKKMCVHTVGRRDARAQAHVTALKSLGCFLMLHLVYVLASPFSFTSDHSPADVTRVLISETLMAAYPSLHSVILMLGIPKVKQTSLCVMSVSQFGMVTPLHVITGGGYSHK